MVPWQFNVITRLILDSFCKHSNLFNGLLFAFVEIFIKHAVMYGGFGYHHMMLQWLYLVTETYINANCYGTILYIT